MSDKLPIDHFNVASVEKVYAAANDLVKSGKRPTLAAIREELGGGSFTTITEVMKSWRSENMDSKGGI